MKASKKPRPDAEVLLDRLLTAWRDTHDPGLEPQIGRIGVAIARERGPITAKSKAALETAWLAVARVRDPGDLDRLLDAPWPGLWKVACSRARALAKLEPDPRMHKLAAIACAYTSFGARAFHELVAKILERSPTPASVPGLDAIKMIYEMEQVLYETTRAAIAQRRVTAADPALIEAAGDSDAPVDLDALRAEHAKSPGDLGLRAVLADALQHAGDPRGEFITLQLAIAAGTADAKARARASALLKSHGDSWTGPLPGVVAASVRFERGFLTALRTTATPEALAASANRPEWRTVEELVLSHRPSTPLPVAARMPLLRRLWTQIDHGLATYAAEPRPALEVLACGVGHGIADCAWLATKRDAFPNLRVFLRNCPREWREGALFTKYQQHAVELGLHAVVHLAFPRPHIADAVKLRADGPPETRFTIEETADSFEAAGWRLRVFRDSDRAELAWGGGPLCGISGADGVCQQLSDAGITEIAVHIRGKAAADVTSSIAKRVKEIEKVLDTDVQRRIRAARCKLDVRFDAEQIDLTRTSLASASDRPPGSKRRARERQGAADLLRRSPT